MNDEDIIRDSSDYLIPAKTQATLQLVRRLDLTNDQETETTATATKRKQGDKAQSKFNQQTLRLTASRAARKLNHELRWREPNEAITK